MWAVVPKQRSAIGGSDLGVRLVPYLGLMEDFNAGATHPARLSQQFRRSVGDAPAGALRYTVQSWSMDEEGTATAHDIRDKPSTYTTKDDVAPGHFKPELIGRAPQSCQSFKESHRERSRHFLCWQSWAAFLGNPSCRPRPRTCCRPTRCNHESWWHARGGRK